MTSGLELLERYARKGEEEAFSDFIQLYVNLVFSVAKRRLGNLDLAEEAVQLVFIRLARAKPRFATEAQLVGWLHRTATNVAIDLWRAESRRRAREREWMQTEANENLEAMAQELDKAIDRLQEREREVILLRFFAKRKMSELGAALGVSEDAAKMRVSRAVESLRGKMAKAGIVCASAALLEFLGNSAAEVTPAGLAERTAEFVAKHALSRSPFLKLGITAGISALVILGIAVLFVFQQEITPSDTKAQTVTAVEMPMAQTGDAPRSGVIAKGKARLVNAATGEPATGDGVIVARYFKFRGEIETHKVAPDDNGIASIPEARMQTPEWLDLTVTVEGFVPASLGWRIATNLPYAIRKVSDLPAGIAKFATEVMPPEFVVQLDPARTFTGRVLNEEGAPVPGVLIRVQAPSGFIFFQEEQAVMSDAGGNWRLPFVPKWWSETPVLLDKEGFATTLVNIPTKEEAPSVVDLVIRKGVVVTGQIRDTKGTPIANAKINEVRSKDLSLYWFPDRSVNSDGDGRFTMERMVVTEQPLGRILIEAQAPGLVARVREVKLTEATNVLDFTLSKRGLLRGRVVDENGFGLAEAMVEVLPTNYFQEYRWRTKTDESGRFEWDGAPEETTYQIMAFRRHKGNNPAELFNHPLLPVELVLKADGVEREILVKEWR